MSLDLLIVIRCHAFPDLVIDTWQAAKYCTGPSTEVVFAVDGNNPRFAQKLVSIFGSERVYVSQVHWGWGSGLFCLLVDAYSYFKDRYEFNHYQSIDYDTLYIQKDADKKILDRIDSPDIGLLGCHGKDNEHWRAEYKRTQKKFESVFGKVPPSYIQGEGVQGGAMLLTASLIDRMKKRRMFEPPFSIAKRHTGIADDHLLPIFVRMCELKILDISDIASCYWRAKDDPRGYEKKGIVMFHPTKLRPENKNKSTDIEIRNYFRKLRQCKDLLT